MMRVLFSLVTFSLVACRPDEPPRLEKQPALAEPTPPHVVPMALGSTGFALALPATYALKAVDGPDFLVYYFAPVDTTVRTTFTGGLYFGNHPQGGSDTTAGCQVRQLPATLLRQPVVWTVRRCATGYSLDGVFDNPRGQPGQDKINAFGEARSAAELRQLQTIIASLQASADSAQRP